jgi:hypothetical protein
MLGADDRVERRAGERSVEGHEVHPRRRRQIRLQRVGNAIHVIVVAIRREDDRDWIGSLRRAGRDEARGHEEKWRERRATYSSQPH